MKRLYPVVSILLVVALTFSGCVVVVPPETTPTPPAPTALPPTPTLPAPTALSPTPTPEAAADLPDVTFAEVVAQAAALAPALRDLRGQLDRTQFDLQELSFAVGFEADDVIAFVRDQLAFEQYPGLLRGAYGTLLSRAGNALDQAVLLATLLNDVGYEARIVRGALSEAQVQALLREMVAPRPAAPALGDLTAIEQGYLALGAAAGLTEEAAHAQFDAALNPPPVEESPAYPAAQTDADFILQALADAGIALGDPQQLAALVAEAQDYFWVEYRLGPSDPWTAAHPVFADAAAAPADLTASETFAADDVPPTLQHRFRMEVVIEQKDGDTLTTAALFPAWEQPVANLVGVPLSYQNQSSRLQGFADLAALEEALAGNNIFMPVLNGDVVTQGNAFDTDGRLYAMGLLSMDTFGITPLFQSVGGALEGATEALEGDGEVTGNLLTLTAQWIDYTLIAPGGQETTYRRTVLDRIGPENRAQGVIEFLPDSDFPEAAKALLTNYTIVVLPGTYPQAYLSDRVLERVGADMDILAFYGDVADGAGDADLPELPLNLLDALRPLEDVMLEGAFAAGTAGRAGFINYRPEPTLVVVERGLLPNRPQPTGFARVDIVNNTRRVFAVAADGALTPAADEAVRSGVWETHTEELPLQGLLGTRFNTVLAFARANAAGISTRVLTPDDAAQVDGLALPAEAKYHLRRDLDAGYVVIVPEALPAGETHAGWWRIDPATGETLGMGSGGRGQAAVEMSFLQSLALSVLVGGPLGLVGYSSCRNSGGSAACCAAENAAYFGAGFALGYAVGLKMGSAAAFLLVDVFVGGAVTIGGASNVIPSFCY